MGTTRWAPLFLALILLVAPDAVLAAPVWTEQTSVDPTGYWWPMAGSDDGSILIAANYYDGHLYTSTDGGATWTQRIEVVDGDGWYSVTVTADGSKLAAGENGGYVYTSTDGGANWTKRESIGVGNWRNVAYSGDGSTLVAGHRAGGYIKISHDDGATWTEKTGSGFREWYYGATALSYDGSTIVAGTADDYIYTSTDGGNTWIERSTMGANSWVGMDVSDDGRTIIGGTFEYVYTSTDGGATWTQQTGPGTGAWYAVEASSDGRKFLVGNYDEHGHVFTSTDGGAHWTDQVGAGERWWGSAFTTSNGVHAVLGVDTGYIYTTDLAITPVLSGLSVVNGEFTWTTDQTTSSQVEYGITTNHNDTSVTSTNGTSHSITLENLENCTEYYYEITSAELDYQLSDSETGSFMTGDCVSGGGSSKKTHKTAVPTAMAVQDTSPDSPGPTSSANFSRNLSLHDSGEDVKALQIYLNQHGFPLATTGVGSPGQETNYFGALTFQALKLFQEAHQDDILVPAGLSQGTGYFGPLSRSFIQN